MERLLYLNDEFLTGDGSNSHANGLYKSFSSLLGEENVYAFPHPQDGSSKKINHRSEWLKKKFKGPLQLVRFLRKSILSYTKSKTIITELCNSNFKPTIIVCRATVFDVTALYLSKHYKAKLVYELNTPFYYETCLVQKEPLKFAVEKWERKIIEKSDIVYTVSEVSKDMLIERYGVPKAKFCVAPNGFDGDCYTESPEEIKSARLKERAKLKLQNEFVITFLGNLKKWHGIDLLCRVAECYKSCCQVKFVIIGDGEMHDYVENYINTNRNVLYVGKVNKDRVKNLLYASDLGIMPYENSEYFYYSPLKMFDMIGANLPFIGTSVGQIRDICQSNNMNEFLVETADVANYEKAINDVISNPLALADMKEKLASISNNYTWDSCAKKILECLIVYGNGGSH